VVSCGDFLGILLALLASVNSSTNFTGIGGAE
jgi:hypothetical protein